MKDFLSSYEQKIWLASLIAMLVTAFFSAGYFHADEHFQILEFINYKLGKTPVEELPWEFGERMRPTLQVALAYGAVKFFNGIGISNPFILVLCLRLISALLTWLLLFKISKILVRNFSSIADQKMFLAMFFLLWFVPLIGVRYSSENFSALAFFTGVYLLLQTDMNVPSGNKWNSLWAGLIIGFSFYFRFQIGFAIAGLFAWLFFIQKISFGRLLMIGISMILAFVISTGFDYWFYGELTCTPYHYFRANILENKAANFGVSPWWNYLKLFIFKGIPPISIVLLISFLIGLYHKPKSVFTWCIVPFIIGHSFVGHKELRFMFPMSIAFIYLSAFGANYLMQGFRAGVLRKVLSIIVIGINLFLLLGVMISPAQPVANLYKFLYTFSANNKVELLCKEKSPYDIRDLNVYFYKSSHLDCIVVNDGIDVGNYLGEHRPEIIHILERKFNLKDSYEGYTSKRVYSSFPDWLEHFNVNHWMDRTSVWSVFELKREE